MKKKFLLLITMAAFLLFLFSSPQLSGAGDTNIAEYLASSKIKSGFFFISPVLAYILRMLNYMYSANWWAFFSIAVMFIGLFIILWFFNKRYEKYGCLVQLFLAYVFVLFFWELMLKYEVNFTQTAVIASLSSILLILDCCFDHMNQKLVKVKIFMGGGGLLLAGAIRWKAVVMTVPFALMCLGYMFLFPLTSSNMIQSVKESFLNKRKLLLLAGVIVFTVVLSNGVHQLYGTMNTDLGEYVKANGLREDICDYSDRYLAYEGEGEQIYQKIGIKQSWIQMAYHFLTSDSNHFSSENLEKMVGLRQKSTKTVGDFVNEFESKHILLGLWILVLTGFVLVLRKRNAFLPFVGSVLAFVFCAVYFVWLGRIKWHVTNGVILACMCSFLTMSEHSVCDVVNKKIKWKEKNVFVVLTGIFLLVGYASVKLEKGDLCFPRASGDSYAESILDYMDSNPDITYFNIDDALRFYDSNNIWASHSPDYLDNSFSLAGNFILGEKETLASQGIHDIIHDMLKKPNIYLKYSPVRNTVFFNYIRDYYDPCTSISIVDVCGYVRFLRYAEPVVPESEYDYDEDIKVSFGVDNSEYFMEDKEILGIIQSEFLVELKEKNSYQEYYLNITDHNSGHLYSYGLKFDGNSCNGGIIWMDETWNADDLSVCLVGRNADGHCDSLVDVTDEFLAALQSVNLPKSM